MREILQKDGRIAVSKLFGPSKNATTHFYLSMQTPPFAFCQRQTFRGHSFLVLPTQTLAAVGEDEGFALGESLGWPLGELVGWPLGELLGMAVGVADGF